MSALREAMVALKALEAPRLPDLDLIRLYAAVGWGVVIGALAFSGLRGALPRRRWRGLLAVALVLLCQRGDAWSPAWWLTQTFSAPAGLTVLLAVWSLGCGIAGEERGVWRLIRPWAGVLTLLGLALSADVLALWPIELWPLGFAPGAVGLLAAAGLAPLCRRQRVAGRVGLALLWPCALLLHAAWSLPSGNAWDAVLDPPLWLALAMTVLLDLWRRCRRGPVPDGRDRPP